MKKQAHPAHKAPPDPLHRAYPSSRRKECCCQLALVVDSLGVHNCCHKLGPMGLSCSSTFTDPSRARNLLQVGMSTVQQIAAAHVLNYMLADLRPIQGQHVVKVEDVEMNEVVV